MVMNKYGQGSAGAGFALLFIGLAIGAFFWVMMSWDYVPAGSVGVKDHLGVIDDKELDAGWWYTGFFTSTLEFSTRTQKVEYGASAASSDLQTVETSIAVNYDLDADKASDIYRELGMDYEDKVIRPIVQEAVKSQTAKYKAEELIKNRENVKASITDYLQAKLDPYGLNVKEVAITNFDFSDSFNEAIEAKQVAEQNALRAENQLREMEFNAKAMELQRSVIEIKKLDIQQAFIDKWNGQLPTTIMGDDTNILAMLPVNNQ